MFAMAQRLGRGRLYHIDDLVPYLESEEWNIFLLDSWRYETFNEDGKRIEHLDEILVQARWYYTFTLMKRWYERYYKRRLSVYKKTEGAASQWWEINYANDDYDKVVKRVMMFIDFIKFYRNKDIAWCISTFYRRFSHLDLINQMDAIHFCNPSDIGSFTTDAKYFSMFNQYRVRLKLVLRREPDWLEIFWLWFEQYREDNGKTPSMKVRKNIFKRLYQYCTGLYGQYPIVVGEQNNLEILASHQELYQ